MGELTGCHVNEQDSETNMLFGLYKNLVYARRDEWPKLKNLVVNEKMGKIKLVGGDVGLCLADENLYNANHNMIHFACFASDCRGNMRTSF